MVTLDDVKAAAARIEGRVERTPVISNTGINAVIGAEVFLKAECLQTTGSFKLRGATNAVAQLSADARSAGVITYSSGNHAQAVAAAAKAAGTTAVVVMPSDAPLEKVAATDALGARIVRYDRYDEDRVAIAEALADFEGRAIIPPFDHDDVIAGQGTVALELFDEQPDLDALFVPVGGGGLLAGCATVAHARGAGVQIYGVEPEAGDDHRRSRREGRRVDIGVPRTIADGQQVSSPGKLTWEITNRLTTRFLTVTDDQIITAMSLLFERTSLLVEPSGASALAAVMSGAVPVAGNRVGVVLSGGNIGWPRFRELTKGG